MSHALVFGGDFILRVVRRRSERNPDVPILPADRLIAPWFVRLGFTGGDRSLRPRSPAPRETSRTYERQGILVEPDALRRAEEESLADAEVRARRQARAAERRELEDHEFVTAFASAIREQYPGCPTTEEVEIAEHACRKHSGRVGRTAAAKELSPDAIRLAVIAHIRHVHTNYDELLARYADRDMARERIRGDVSAILADWQAPGSREKHTG
jgi:hypothetical protein